MWVMKFRVIFICIVAIFVSHGPGQAEDKKSISELADAWVTKNGGKGAASVDSYWPGDALLDLTVGKNKTPAMKKIIDKVVKALRENYDKVKDQKSCLSNASYGAWDYANDRNSIFASSEFKKFALKFGKTLASLPKSMTGKVLDAGKKALADKLKDKAKGEGKKLAKKALDEFRKFMQKQRPEVFSKNGSITSGTAGRCEISIRVVWNKQASTYSFLIIGNCTCDCDPATQVEKKSKKIKTLKVTGTGSISIAIKGKGFSIRPGLARFDMAYQCCGDGKGVKRTHSYGAKANKAAKPKVAGKSPEDIAAEKRLKELADKDPKKEVKDGLVDKFGKEIDAAKTIKELEAINDKILEKRGAVKNQITVFPPGKTRDAAKKLLEQIDKLIEKKLWPKIEELDSQSSFTPGEDILYDELVARGLLLCPADAFWSEPVFDPSESTTVWREPIALETVVRLPNECVGTTYILTTTDGFKETILTEVTKPVVILKTPEPVVATPAPEPEATSTPEDAPGKTDQPEQPDIPVVTQIPEPREPLEEVPDLGLVKASETVVELALSGEVPENSFEGAVIKLLPPEPPLPSDLALFEDGDEVDDEFRDLIAYQSDVASGLFEDDGTVEVVAQFNRGAVTQSNDDLLNSLIEPVESGKAAEKTDNLIAGQKVFVQKVKTSLSVEPQQRTPLVIALSPAGPEDEPSELTLKQLLEDAGEGDAPVARAYMIGNIPVYTVLFETKSFEQTRIVLAQNTQVIFVEEDPCRNKEELSDTHYSGSGLWGQAFDNQWAIKRVGFTQTEGSAFDTPSNIEASPVVVAVIDTGIDWYHPDLPGKALWKNPAEIPDNGIDDDGNGYVDDVMGWDFVHNDNRPWDNDGHGTFVAGVIAAGQNNDTGIAGINPDAQIMVLKALDTFGQGYASMVAEAITYAVDNGARIINLSLGGKGITEIEKLAISHARSNGVIVVVAAGNAGSSLKDYAPAGLQDVITVSATDRNDKRAGFSNWGPAVDIAAPGVDVLSLRARDTDLLAHIPGVKYIPDQGIVGEDRAYFRASGTSFAAPIVSGTLSLMLSRNPALNREQATRMLLNAARDIDTPGIDNFTGYGLLDAQKALAADPDYFIESRILGVKVVRIGKKVSLQINGIADADLFKQAKLQLGRGAKPKKWLRLKKPIVQQKADGVLMVLPAAIFAKTKIWVLRLIVEHEDGSKRISNFQLKLG